MRYLLGLDFGTKSVRTALVSETGEIVKRGEVMYSHGLIMRPDDHENLKNWEKDFPPETVLQDPADYLKAMEKAVKKALARSGVPKNKIKGIGIAFTACTILPVAKTGVPLCQIEMFKNNPYAFVKKWKHQAAKEEAALIEKVARERNEPFLKQYGGKMNVQFALPKILETLNRAPEVYSAAARFIEAGDWIVWQLTGQEKRGFCFAGYKESFVPWLGGFPSREFLKTVDERLRNLAEEKLCSELLFLGEKAGGLSENWAEKLGLEPDTPVAAAGIDAHLGAIGAGIAENKMVIVMGTSFCHMYTSLSLKGIPGMFGIVEDGIIPGMFGYEAGQAAGGDILASFAEESVGLQYHRAAKKMGLSIQSYLTKLAEKYRPGQTGLLYLDWQAGNRSILGDSKLSGLLVGEKLDTTAPQRYRALLESLCFGTYKIIEEMEKAGLTIEELIVCGGVAFKNSLILQILSDVADKKVILAKNPETVALGSAAIAGVAGKVFSSIGQAQKKMAGKNGSVFLPNRENHETYRKLFALYEREHDHFGRGSDDIMKELLELKGGV